jgi:hypothetical protein
LKKSMTNIASECRSANIVRDHAVILPDDSTPKPVGIFGKDRASTFILDRFPLGIVISNYYRRSISDRLLRLLPP